MMVVDERLDEGGALGVEDTEIEDGLVHHDRRLFDRRRGPQQHGIVDGVVRRFGDRWGDPDATGIGGSATVVTAGGHDRGQ
jgi:hypothetical protein